ncbi:hypothetical protein [Thermococcus peptonophilus]|uniref:hypothetical protein n=1 Tax=Thermococcus peptonophilus TaxID=53952 RepID=UPI000AF62F09
MDDRIWKYISAVLILLLALSVVSIAVLYYQVNPPAVSGNQTGPVVETPSKLHARVWWLQRH